MINIHDLTPNTTLPRFSTFQRARSQYEVQSLSQQLKMMKSVDERNNFLRRLVRQKQLKKILDEQQTLKEKAHILQSSKKKFLSLIRSKEDQNDSHQFMKFKPTQKPLNMLRMMHELKISDRQSRSVDETDRDKDKKSISTMKKSKKQQSDSTPRIEGKPFQINSNNNNNINNSNGPLQFLTSEKKSVISKRESIFMREPQKFVQPKKLQYFITQSVKLKLLTSDDEEVQTQEFKKNRIPSQILARNGIILSKNSSVKSIKVNQQEDKCLEDDNSSLASHTEMMLDNIYSSALTLKPSTRHFDSRKKEYENESIRLFYKKVFQK